MLKKKLYLIFSNLFSKLALHDAPFFVAQVLFLGGETIENQTLRKQHTHTGSEQVKLCENNLTEKSCHFSVENKRETHTTTCEKGQITFLTLNDARKQNTRK